MLLPSGTQAQVTHTGCPPQRMCTLEADGSILKMNCVLINTPLCSFRLWVCIFCKKPCGQNTCERNGSVLGLPQGHFLGRHHLVPKPPGRSPTGTTPWAAAPRETLKTSYFGEISLNRISRANSIPGGWALVRTRFTAAEAFPTREGTPATFAPN